MLIDRVLSGVDLVAVHTVLALAGMFLAVFVMQVTHYEAEDKNDPWVLRETNRLGLGLYALAMLGSLAYSYSKQWQPWPPDLAVFAVVDLMLIVRVVAIWAHVRRTGHRFLGAKTDKSRA
jgi:NO-binding membrane sensor protein with MHYT domain